MPGSKHPSETDKEFYESLGATADRYFQPDIADEPESHQSEPGLNEIKVTAIVTITLTILVAIGLALLILRALDLMRSVTPT